MVNFFNRVVALDLPKFEYSYAHLYNRWFDFEETLQQLSKPSVIMHIISLYLWDVERLSDFDDMSGETCLFCFCFFFLKKNL